LEIDRVFRIYSYPVNPEKSCKSCLFQSVSPSRSIE
jgi:hypothetical protein